MANRKSPCRGAPSICPVCGEDVPRNAVACQECGADDRSGWRTDGAAYDGVDLPGDFDYEEFAQEEFGSQIKPRHLSPFWWVAGILVLAALIILFLNRGGL